MFRVQLFLCVLVLAAFSPADAVERYQEKWRYHQQEKLRLLAATTTPAPVAGIPVAAAPCFSYGCPSLNKNCKGDANNGVTGASGVPAASCIVDYTRVAINLNMATPTAAAAALKVATTNALVVSTIHSLADNSINKAQPAFGAEFISIKSNKMGMSIITGITCNNCGAAALKTAANNFMNAVPPYMFAAVKVQLVDVWTCWANDTTTDGICLDNVNLVVGNPPAPTTGNGGAGASAGVIIGAVAGGVVGVLAIAGGIYVYKKRQAQFNTTSRNISSSNATAHTVSGPVTNPGVGMGMNNNFNQGAQMQQMQRPNQYMPNNGMGMQQNNASPRAAPMNPGYGQNQNWNNNQGYNNRGWN